MGNEQEAGPSRRRTKHKSASNRNHDHHSNNSSSSGADPTLAPYPPPKIPFEWSRVDLYLTAKLLRFLAIFAFWIHHMWYKPYGNPPDHSFYIDSTISHNYPSKKAIKIYVYLPPSPSPSPLTPPSASSLEDQEKVRGNENGKGKRSAIINFHGGGFALGSAVDDSRLCRMFTNHIEQGAIVFSVEYRLAPEYPWPTMVEDSTEAVIEICKLHKEYDFDLDKVYISGGSAGGNGALTSWILLNSMKEYGYSLNNLPVNGKKIQVVNDKKESMMIPKIKGMILLYPLLNYSVARKIKKLTIPNDYKRSDWKLNRFFLRLFDLSYIYPLLSYEQRKHPLISPTYMSDKLINILPPVYMILCEYDMLRYEAMGFIDRLREWGKEVEYQVIKGKGHGWDKPLPFKPHHTVEGAHLDCVKKVNEWNTDSRDKEETRTAGNRRDRRMTGDTEVDSELEIDDIL